MAANNTPAANAPSQQFGLASFLKSNNLEVKPDLSTPIPSNQPAYIQQFQENANKRRIGGFPFKGGNKRPKKEKTTANNAVQYMHHRYPIVNQLLTFEEGKTPSNTRFYRCYVELDGMLFSGEGSNKKVAKQLLAERVVERVAPAGEREKILEASRNETAESSSPGKPGKGLSASIPKNVVMLVNELSMKKNDAAWKPDYELKQIETKIPVNAENPDGPKEKLWSCTLKCYGNTFFATSPAKDCAKKKAARQAALELFGASESQMTETEASLAQEDSLAREKFKLGQSVSKRSLTASKKLNSTDPVALGQAFAYKIEERGPVAVMNELCMKLGTAPKYEIDTVGGVPPTAGCDFEAVIKVKEKEFRGVAKSRKDAKVAASCVVLKDIFAVVVDPKEYQTGSTPGAVKMAKKQKLEQVMASPQAVNRDKIMKPMAETKDPVQLLHELTSKSKMGRIVYSEEPEEVVGKTRYFVMKAVVNDQEFTGTGTSKKLAKHAIARDALYALFEIGIPDKTVISQMMEQAAKGGVEIVSSSSDHTAPKEPVPPIADLTANLVKRKYFELCRELGLPQRPTHLAGFVVTMGPNPHDSVCVSLASGATTISRVPQTDGLELLDSHSEVLARRGLLLFFYHQLSLLDERSKAHTSIFEPLTGTKKGIYKLKDNIKVHFYSSLPPSGDACRANQKTTSFENTAPTVGSLMTYKHEDGTFITTKEAQMTDTAESSKMDAQESGFNFGMESDNASETKSRPYIMTTSDKILKWNALGVQGALLSHLVEPIQIETIAIGSSMYEKDSAAREEEDEYFRALFGRGVQKVEPKKSSPLISHISIPQTISSYPTEIPDEAVVWTSAAPGVELIAQQTGLDLTGKPSRLCKQFLFEQFAKIYGKLNPLGSGVPKWKSYGEAKKVADYYQMKRNELIAKMEQAGLGPWMTKSMGMENFSLPWCD